MPYRFREDMATADVAFEAWGATREESFSANAIVCWLTSRLAVTAALLLLMAAFGTRGHSALDLRSSATAAGAG